MKNRPSRRLVVICVLFSIIVGCVLLKPKTTIGSLAELTGDWTQIWGDDFNSPENGGVDTSKWNYDLGHGYPVGASNWGTGEVENMTNNPSEIRHDGNGNLVITSNKDGADNWSAARIETPNIFYLISGARQQNSRMTTNGGTWQQTISNLQQLSIWLNRSKVRYAAKNRPEGGSTNLTSAVSNGTAIEYWFTYEKDGPLFDRSHFMYTFSGASGPTSTPISPTATFQPTSTPSTGSTGVVNSGFEDGLKGWSTGGVLPPVLSTTQQHGGTTSLQLGSTSNASEQNGDSFVTQTVSVPSSGGPVLTFWYWPATVDSIQYDWQEAQIRTTSGTPLDSIFKVCSNAQAWTQVTYYLSNYRGQTIQLYFNVHGDGSNDATYMYLDDVSISASEATATFQPTSTPISPTATFQPTSTPISPTATFQPTSTPIRRSDARPLAIEEGA